MDHQEKEPRKRHPRETANWASVITFFYTLKLFRKGFRRDLTENDLYEVISTHQSKKLGDQMEQNLEQQKSTRKHLSISKLLWTCYGWEYLGIGIMQLLVKTSLIIIQPRALGKLIAYFSPNQTELTKNDAIYYGVLVVGLNIVHCVYVHNYHFLNAALSVRVRAAFCSLLYRKALKLRPNKLSDISIGKIVTLMTKDVQSFDYFVHFANDLWVGMVKTAVLCYVIYNRIGIAALAGVGFFFVVMPLQIYLGKWTATLRMKMCKRTDTRLQLTQETLSAIKIIKMYTWENFFKDKITQSRGQEISSLHKTFYLKFIILAIGTLNAKLAFYILIMTYIWLGNFITAEIVYFLQSCFQMLIHTLSVIFPLGVNQTAEVFAAMKRMGNVLKSMEIQTIPHSQEMTIKPKIIMKDVSVNFNELEILHDINLNMEMGVTLITGPVGGGKSFLLKTILQDYALVKGDLEIHGQISYASQEPWLFPSSIKQNILFGGEYDEKRYQQVLQVCALQYDFDLLSAGDSTIVEDRGINLSKGQQARINLARAVYRESDIYLLDDCLSALDAHVSDFIFRECIMKFLKNKLVILVTHNTSFVRDVDNVIILKEGRIKSNLKSSEITEKEVMEDLVVIEEQNEDDFDIDDDDDEKKDSDEKAKLITETTTERKVYHEVNKEGKVDFGIYKKYIGFGGGFFILTLLFTMFGGAQFVISYTDKLVAKWVNFEEGVSNFTSTNQTNSTEYIQAIEKRNSILNLYTGMIVAATLLNLARSLSLFQFSKKASINLHRYMIDNVVNAAMQFFDSNFIGNILNRFSKDLSTIDEFLPFAFFHVFRVFFILLGIVTLIATVNTGFLIPSGITFVLLSIVRYSYIRTGRSLKRLDAATRSPVIGHLNATLEGLTTIRAFKAEHILRDEFDRHQDLYTSAHYTMQNSMRAFAYCLDTICAFFIGVIVVKFLIFNDETLAGNVGLAITQAFMLTGTLQWGIRQWAEIENQMTSVERVLEYTEVKQENKQGLVLEKWPINGTVIYENVSLTYTNSPERVLKNLNFIAKPKEKIGIVGRTGAGKSSIISTLFRLYDVEGRIIIDDIDIKTLSLDFLRSKISIIPQDPVLFTGNIRDNIDPNKHYTDDAIWKAIEISNLKPLIPSLDFEITENGSNFSVGQRQLICLARAVIKNNKIIVLDEATANMDHETDTLIQETIQKNLKNCTVFTIAHKLQTILHSDKVVVMEKGEIIEFDDPSVLLENKTGMFYKMVAKAGLLPEPA